jgi:hypothetical protein
MSRGERGQAVPEALAHELLQIGGLQRRCRIAPTQSDQQALDGVEARPPDPTFEKSRRHQGTPERVRSRGHCNRWLGCTNSNAYEEFGDTPQPTLEFAMRLPA